MRLIYGAPAPLGASAGVRTKTESSNILAALRDAQVQVSLAGLLPASMESLARLANERVAVLHLAVHASFESIQVEQRSGEPLVVSPQALANVLGEVGADLVVLNGCETEELGLQLQERCRSSIIATTGYVADEVCASFAGFLYPSLMTGSEIRTSYERAVQLVREVEGQAPYHLFSGDVAAFDVLPGDLTVERTFVLARARAEVDAITGRNNELVRLHSFLDGTPSSIIWITGAPQSGVSTFLRAASAQYDWMFTNTLLVDLATEAKRTETAAENLLMRVEKALSRASDSPMLFLLDHLDRLDHRTTDQLLDLLATSSLHDRSRVIIGAGSVNPDNTIALAKINLGELSFNECTDLIAYRLGLEQAKRLSGVVRKMPKLPGRLLTLVSDVENGAADEELELLASEGDPRSGLNRIFNNLARDKDVLLLVRCITYAGNRVPRSAVQSAFIQGASTPDAGRLKISFEEAVAVLRAARVLWVEEDQSSGGSVPEAYFRTTQDFLHAASENMSQVSPRQHRGCILPLAENILERVRSKRLSAASDGSWVSNVAQACRKHGLDDLLTSIGAELLGRHGIFRKTGAPIEIEPLARVAFDSAREIGEFDSASQIGLVLGETLYQAGRLDPAEQTFKQCLALPSNPQRKLQALRALGQVSYRRGDYRAALKCYDTAAEYEPSSPEYVVATLRQQRGKALFRLGLLDQATAELTEVLQYRQSQDDFRATLNVQHELGRVLQARGNLDDAAEIFQMVVLGAESHGFEKLLAPSLYQLCILELTRGDVDSAEAYHRRCSAVVERIKAPLWDALSELAGARVDFARSRGITAMERISAVVMTARERGFSQVIDDVREWVRNAAPTSADLNQKEVPVQIDALAQLESVSPNKVEKALRYAAEPNRISSIEIKYDSDSATRTIEWRDGEWTCTCDLFKNSRMCSHLTAISLLEGSPWHWPHTKDTDTRG
ncbi:CHAT domain-containing tetratricopeptide repeat protein [Lentzea californiensis]|uniref:CHAT domain-containing tetratricopeptide repeat protein n=1 Tax=Lentzea californiensis TaxID=438851 RepID=UPI0021665EC7|nr:tetratricopeptide repeat protein [Lentzea californiensis]MCR3752680.1 TPR repeat-containing protein [Lentzea californiensis]